MIQYFPIVTGSLTVLGNINVSGSITTSGSITISGSITSASFASTASFVANAQTASYVLNAVSSSFASTASFVALAQSASNAVSAATASFANNLTVAGTLTAQTLVVQTITSSVDFVTGSTRFGSLLDNTHQFTGSVSISGSLSGSSANFIGRVTGNGGVSSKGGYATFEYNSSATGITYPSYDTYYGAIGTNFSNGGSELDIWNTVGGGFVFRRQTAASAQTALLTIASNGAATFSGSVTANAIGSLFNANNGTLSADILTIKGGGGTGAFGFRVEANNGQAIFRTNNFTYNILMCENGGYVGIGTSSPSSRLYVRTTAGATKAYDDLSKTNIMCFDDTSMVEGVGGSITFGGYKTSTSAGGNFAAIDGIKENGTAGNEAGAFRIWTANSSGVFGERMRITSAGKIGLGNSNPNNIVDIYGTGSNTVGLLGVRSSGGGTFIMGRLVSAEASNQTQTIATCSTGGTNERIFLKIQVVNVSAVQNLGNVHVGYALWNSSGGVSVTTMTLDSGNSNIGNTNVGSLSWSGNNLQYTTNRNGNYEMNHITIWACARDSGVVS